MADEANAEKRGARLATALSVVCAVLGAAIARFITSHGLGDVPHVMDEIAYVLQAKTFAGGHLASPVGIPRAAFTMWFVEDRASRFSIFPPGWPLILALGVKLHLKVWVNPILHAATTVLVGFTARRLAGPRAQVLASAIYAFSPQTLALAGSFMSHPLVAACGAIVTYAVVRLWQGEARRFDYLAVGAALSMTAATRPLCALALFVFFVAALAVFRAKVRPRLALLTFVPLVASVLLLGGYNAALTGSATKFPQTYYFDEHLPPVNLPIFNYHPGCNDLGFGPGHGCDFSIRNGTHDLQNALSNTGDNVGAWLMLLGGGPLVFLAAAYDLFRARKEPKTELQLRALLVLPAVTVVGLYALYWYAGTCYGARFYHAAVPALLLVAALGLSRIKKPLVLGAVLALWLGWNGFAAVHVERELEVAYWGNDARFAHVADKWTGKDALIMVAYTSQLLPIEPLTWSSSLLHGGKWLNSIRSLSALGQNSPYFDGPVVFAKFHPGLVDKLREQFPNREMWLYVAAPNPADDHLERYRPELLPLDEPLYVPAENFDGYKVDGEPRVTRDKR